MDKKDILFKNRLDNAQEGEYERDLARQGQRAGSLCMAAILAILVGYRMLVLGETECFDLFALAFSYIAAQQTYVLVKLRDRKLIWQVVTYWFVVLTNLAFYLMRG